MSAEDSLPPLRWQMGRIQKLYAGNDEINRVAKLKTSTGILIRPIVKLRSYLYSLINHQQTHKIEETIQYNKKSRFQKSTKIQEVFRVPKMTSWKNLTKLILYAS